MTTASKVNSGRRQLLVIMAVAFVSLGGSYWLYYLAQDGSGWGTTNNGTFVEQGVTTQSLGWHVVHPQDSSARRTWWIWIHAQQCNQPCITSVDQMRALHILLNRESDRVRRAFTGDTQGLDEDDHRFAVTSHTAPPNGDGVYLVDPLGNLVLYFALGADPKTVLEDLKKLLKVSQIG